MALDSAAIAAMQIVIQDALLCTLLLRKGLQGYLTNARLGIIGRHQPRFGTAYDPVWHSAGSRSMAVALASRPDLA
jgi:hypothetical protein